MKNDAPAEVTAVTFESFGLPPEIVSALAADGITKPFPIQELTIPDGLAGRDVCGKAKTGSGKTLAFGLPLIERTKKAKPKHPTSLVLVPTRELASQVAGVLKPLAALRDKSLVLVYGGVAIGPQIDTLKAGVDIVVATPGRLIDLMERGAADLRDVELVVLDEADQMVDMGFQPQVEFVLRGIRGGHQTMLFSATLEGIVGSIADRYLDDPVRHEVASSTTTVETMVHRFLEVHGSDKPKVAAAIARSTDRTLMFAHTKRTVDRVVGLLRDEGVRADPIHGDLPQAMREKSLKAFSEGRLPVLVATNVAARGLDIDSVDIVLHYDPPADVETYLHRSGRTARAGEAGLVVTLVLWDQRLEVFRLRRAAGLKSALVKVLSNNPMLGDLLGFEPADDPMLLRASRNKGRRRGRRR